MKVKENKQVGAWKTLKLEDQTKSIKGIFPKDYESDEIKRKLKDMKIRLLKIIFFMNGANRYTILEYLKQ